MATNLVSLAMKFLTPELVLKMAQALGLDKGLAQKAVGAAIPAILAGLVGRAAKPDGAKAVADAVGKQDSGLLANLSSMIGGTGQTALINNGTNALTSLLGGSAIGGLSGALAKYAGIGDQPTKSLLGMLGPVVLGALGKEQRDSKLDAAGLGSFLAGQKDNIAAVMPGDFSKLLGGTGLLDSIQPNLRSAAAAAPAATTTATVTTPARKIDAPARTMPSIAAPTAAVAAPAAPWWRLPAIATAGLALVYSLLGSNPPRIVEPAATAQRIVVGDVDVGGQVGTVLDTLRSTLGGVRDVPTAQTAVPRLQEAGSQLDKITTLAAKLPPDTRRALAGVVANGLNGLNPLFASVLAIPGVATVAKPVIDGLRAKLDVLSKS